MQFQCRWTDCILSGKKSKKKSDEVVVSTDDEVERLKSLLVGLESTLAEKSVALDQQILAESVRRGRLEIRKEELAR